MSKQVILTGLRANNDLHIGNYFGALLPMIDMATKRSDEYQVNLFVPDLHSFTTPIDHSQLQAQIAHNIRIYAAAGLPLDNENIHVYRQSYIPAHSELTWILDCFTGMGEISRMTQFREKSRALKEQQEGKIRGLLDVLRDTSEAYATANIKDSPAERLKKLAGILHDAGQKNLANELEQVSIQIHEEMGKLLREQIELFGDLKDAKLSTEGAVGLFNYPVLMAADILLYGATYVPVGDDQTQHLEFARDIADRMNNRFGELFVVPKPVKEQHEFFGKDQGLRIKDLGDPSKKMSKSDETGKGVIFLGDTPEAAAKKIMSATTDSFGEIRYKMDERPGVSNLLQILSLSTQRPLDEVIAEWEGKERYGDLKKATAEAISSFLTEFQANLAKVDTQTLEAKLKTSEEAMNKQANTTLLNVQKAVGLRPKDA